MTKHIPNTITCLSVFCGSTATYFAFGGELVVAACLIFAAAFLDFFDGLAARLLNAKSAIGKDLDSLADVISFGMAPAAIVFFILQDQAQHLDASPLFSSSLPFLAFFIVVFSALRLAIFNNATDQELEFKGIPVPAHALFWVSVAFIYHAEHSALSFLTHIWAIVFGIFFFCYLLVSKLPMFSLKYQKGEPLQSKAPQLLFLVLALFLLLFFGFQGLSICILLYILVSILRTMQSSSKKA